MNHPEEPPEAARMAKQASLQPTRQSIVAALSGSATLLEVAEVMVAQGQQTLQAKSGALALLREETASILIFHASGLSEQMARVWSGFLEELPHSLAWIGMNGRPIWYHHYGEDLSSPAGGQPWQQVFAMLPFTLAEGLRGVLGFGFSRTHELQEPDSALLRFLMQEGCRAMERFGAR